MGQTFKHGTYECLVLCREFLDTQQSVMIGLLLSHIYFNKAILFYFIAVLGDVIFSFNKGKICVFIVLQFMWRIVYTIYFRDMDHFSLNMNCTLGFSQIVNFFISL